METERKPKDLFLVKLKFGIIDNEEMYVFAHSFEQVERYFFLQGRYITSIEKFSGHFVDLVNDYEPAT